MQTILSPWSNTFEGFVRSIRRRAIVVAPFITAQPLDLFTSLLDADANPQISLLTNLSADSLLQGSVDGRAIAEFCRNTPATTVRHLPGLHAKAYVADEHTAIITSGNLTQGSLSRNYEYGIKVSDPKTIRMIARDLQEYAYLGAAVSLDEIDYIVNITATLRDKHAKALNSRRNELRREFEDHLAAVQESLIELRAKPGESTQAVFKRTILYVLRTGPLTTRQIHPLIQNIHPDLCNDGEDRVIEGIRFGKAWKHRVRSAQQALKRDGLIENADTHWRIV